MTDYNGTANPNHKALAFPTTCDTCHTNTDWTTTGMTFNHAAYGGGWALAGAHAAVQCALCHVNNNFNQTPPLVTTCVPCHQNDYNGAMNPPHASSGFPTDCTTCHSMTDWTSATFNHNNVGFALTGFHASMQCVLCHKTSAQYAANSLPTNCYGCHLADYQGTTDPSHVAADSAAPALFPTTCDTCHTTTDWTGATFNHNATTFPLTGFHTTVDCVKCHVGNAYAAPPTPTTCDGCHDALYQAATNPNHVVAKFPTTCDTCHTTTNWTSATLPTQYHTFFPVNHGNANGVCTNCHTNSSDYSVFQCTGCHGGNNAANFHHPNVNGYVYNSVNCYSCHKNGQT
jgi:hypothetical protein